VALAAKRRVVVNAGRRRSRKHNARRKLTAKQIKYFGTPKQKAALKAHRRRKSTSSRARNTASRSRSYLPRKHRARSKNPGEILSLVLNPGGRKKGKSNMAESRSKRSRAAKRGHRRHRARSNRRNKGQWWQMNRRHHRRRSNPAGHRRRHHHRRHRMHNRRRNAGEGSFQNAIGQGLSFMAGYFGSKYVTQLVMTTSNTGVPGYLGNAVATAVLAITAGIFPPTKKFSMALIAGGATQILARIISDNTQIGQLTSALGVGDYQAQNFVTPQRLVDPLGSAQIEIPSGWGAPAPVVVSTASAPGSPAAAVHPAMSGWNNSGFGKGMYSAQGLYS
jgi:hypothetical protein